jgi:hypothetical protein
MLRKDLGPEAAIAGDVGHRAQSTLYLTNATIGQKASDRVLHARNNVLVPAIQEYSESVRRRHSGDVTIAQVHPEQVCVGLTLVLVEGFEPPLYRF